VTRLVWGVAISFAILGAVSGIARAIFIDDLVARVEPVRVPIFAAFGLQDPHGFGRPELVKTVDSRFAQNAAITYTHVLLGAGYLMFGLLQFSSGLRKRSPAYHRRAGRTLVVIGIVMALAGMYFGVVMPVGGRGEAFVVALFGVLFLFALVRGFVAIRKRDRETHRVWMTRAFGIGLGITTVRLVAGPLDLIMTPMGYTTPTIFVVSLWVGWGLTTLGTEYWLYRTQRLVPLPVQRAVPAQP
jgi:uncharacterized membrane protein YozB (DUF420 family)